MLTRQIRLRLLYLAKSISAIFTVLIIGYLAHPRHAVAEEASPSSEFSDQDLEYFESKVRPILAERCLECHGGEAEEPAGGLSMTSHPALLAGGDTGSAIDLSDPDASLILDAINYGEIYEMPPDSKMPSSEIAVLTEWVRKGAPWPNVDGDLAAHSKAFDIESRKQSHWCWQEIRRPELPYVKDKDWSKSAIDDFVLARLEGAGIRSAVPADRRTLIRRLSFDLLGLPPTPQQVADFVSDSSSNALESVVDELLSSPHFGERWARHWMDMIRYAETHGHEFDYPIPHAWEYRDYLIRAFNEDVAYDQLIREHIAGDLLPNPRSHPTEGFNESVIGTGFFYLAEGTHAPVDVKQDQANRIDNQIDVMCKSFLGLTVACARCHDHKFDAISTNDYYALAGYLQSSRRHFAELDTENRCDETVRKIDQLLASSQVSVGAILEKARSLSRSGLEDRIQLDARKILSVAAKDSSALSHEMHTLHMLHLIGKSAELGEDAQRSQAKISEHHKKHQEHAKSLSVYRKNSQRFADLRNGLPEGWKATGFAFQPVSESSTTNGISLSVNSDEQVGLMRSSFVTSAARGTNQRGVLRSPNFTVATDQIHILARGEKVKIRLVIDGYYLIAEHNLLFKGCSTQLDDASTFKWYRLADDLKKYHGHRCYIEFVDEGDGFSDLLEIRFADRNPPSTVRSGSGNTEAVTSVSDAAQAAVNLLIEKCLAACDDSPDLQSPLERSILLSFMLDHELLPGIESECEQLMHLREEICSLDQNLPSPRYVLALDDGSPIDEHVFVRGNHKALGQVAPRRMLQALDDQTSEDDSSYQLGSGRLHLAEQIATRKNPLTARVAVNRIWHHLFGRGIVASVDNFGVLGEKPTHPLLLDWLADQFIEDGWSLKRMIRRIVLSQTYQMSSVANAEAAKLEIVDPENLLLHRARIRRLQGEAIRDAMLAVSGSLDQSLFGKSVPVHLTSFMTGRGRPKKSGPIDGNGRRSVYVEVRRNFLSPMMLAFDTPIPFNSMGRRNVSNVPAQSLILMNDPFVVDQSKRWAKRLLETEETSGQRIRRMYLQAFGRLPTDAEVETISEYLSELSNDLQITSNQSSQDLELWKNVCHVIFNMKEFIYLH